MKNRVVLNQPSSCNAIYHFPRSKPKNVLQSIMTYLHRQFNLFCDRRDEARFNAGYHWAARMLVWSEDTESDIARINKMIGNIEKELRTDKFDDGALKAIDHFKSGILNRTKFRLIGKPNK